MKLTLPFIGLATLATTAFAQSSSDPAIQNSLAAIQNIKQSVQVLIKELDAYHGGLVPLLPLALQVTKVDLNTKKAGNANEQLPDPLSHEQSETLVSTINSTLAVVNPKAVNKLKTKKKFTQPLGVDPLIQAFLQMLLDDHLRFSNAILSRTMPEDVAMTNVPMDVISNALQSGVGFFRD